MPMSSVSANQIPRGGIILWSGLLADIPSTWALCDGSLGTPDLRDRFVKGAAAGIDPGLTGGAATHTHPDHPALVHAGSAVADHAQQTTSTPSTTQNAAGTNPYAAKSDHTHTVPALVHAVTQPNNHAAQAHTAANSEPAYFTVAYIMKL
jgi:hypothetical protein